MRSAKFAALLLGSCLATSVGAHSAPTSTELLVEVEINGVTRSDAAVIRDSPEEGLLLRLADLTSWGIRVPEPAAEDFIPARLIPGVRARMDFAHQRLVVAAAASVLPTVEIELQEYATRDPVPSVPGGFIGYDLAALDEYGARSAAGQIQTGAFAGAWNIGGSWQTRSDEGLLARRLDTSLSRDWPDRMLALRLGDAITTPGYWGRAVRMGGLHWGTDFSAQPDFITFPLPAVRGEAAVPSTVDVYVNGMLRARREVAPGSFSMSDLPVISGNGELRLVVRDALGREQTIQQPYFASEQLLRSDLSMYSIDVGAVREDYGLESFNYGRAIGVGTYRRGLSDRLTAEVRAEVLERQQTAGVGVVASLLPSVMLSGSMARSSADGAGFLAQVGVDVTRGAFNAGVRVRSASEQFRQVAVEADLQRAVDAHIGWLVPRMGSVGLVLASRELRNQDDVRVVSMTYGASLGALGYLGVFASRDLNGPGSSQIALALTRAVGDRSSGRFTASHEDGGTGVGMELNRSLPAAGGAGFHLEAERGLISRLGGGAAWRGDAITVGADVEHVANRERVQAYANGGLVLIGGTLAAVRDIDSSTSFAVVEVPTQSGVPIYHDNHRVAVTDSNGVAVIAGLRPYEANELHLNPVDLPIDVSIASSEYSVRPYRGGGVHVRFPVTDHGGVLVYLMRESGDAVPAGARVQVGEHSFIVARNGAVYVTGVSGHVTLDSSWPGHRCTARIVVPADRVLPDMGEVRCVEAL